MIISNQRLNRPMSSEESHNVDEKSMIDILRSMGIENFDPALPAALNEYARRFASEILCDAKDYSVHACRNEINSSDLATALKLCTTHLTGPEQKEQIIIECRNQINKRSLVDLVNQSAVLHHLPERALIQRSVTYTPWSEAFGEFTTTEDEVVEETELMDTSPQTVSETDIFDADRAPVSLQISAKKAKPIQNNSTFMA